MEIKAILKLEKKYLKHWVIGCSSSENSQTGEYLANSVQKSLNQNIDYAKATAKVGDYFILNCTDTPSILIECGFLSNPEEEKLLQDKEYMQKFCYQILCGLLMFEQFK